MAHPPHKPHFTGDSKRPPHSNNTIHKTTRSTSNLSPTSTKQTENDACTTANIPLRTPRLCKPPAQPPPNTGHLLNIWGSYRFTSQPSPTSSRSLGRYRRISYLLCVNPQAPFPQHPRHSKVPRHTLTASVNFQLPFQLLITLGSYLLFKLGWGVLTFNDVPAAYAELMGEIDIAKSELRLKGVEVD